MGQRFLWSPMQLGPVVVRNRIVFSAHLTNYADDGKPTEQHAAYYGARAAGGAGLIITEEHSTHPTDWPYEKLIHGFHRDVIPGYRRMTDAVHRHRVPIFAQINHNGGQASSMYTRRAVWAPSPVADPLFREVPKAIDAAEIAEVIAGYALVAEHCAEGGFDGIELQCSHSSIVRGFLSPATNKRTDEYGGSLENRMRFVKEVFSAVRAVWPGDKPIGIRVSGTDWVDGGWTPDETVILARELMTLGCDYMDVSSGGLDPKQKIPLSPGYQVPFGERVRREVGIPTMSVGLITGAHQAEEIVSSGKADMVCLARGAMWDPRWAWHAAEELGAETPYAPKTMAGHPKLRPQLFPKRAAAAT